ncbi:hypothetical protein M569_15810 [Genlisea aurea]|uniref:Uncharacterized protein n=1 Tax=Genlisea aurea TaxID=192259 RepID=S8BWM1_9LAMI|nr:hypothetical protein M569_15810 [Genlisea aurea]
MSASTDAFCASKTAFTATAVRYVRSPVFFGNSMGGGDLFLLFLQSTRFEELDCTGDSMFSFAGRRLNRRRYNLLLVSFRHLYRMLPPDRLGLRPAKENIESPMQSNSSNLVDQRNKMKRSLPPIELPKNTGERTYLTAAAVKAIMDAQKASVEADRAFDTAKELASLAREAAVAAPTAATNEEKRIGARISESLLEEPDPVNLFPPL